MVSKKELKFIKSLKVKKYRLREKRFLVEGAKNVLELLKSEFKTDLILCSESFHDSLENQAGPFEIVSEKILQEVGSFKSNNACIAVAHPKEYAVEDINFNSQIFMLDGVNDPGNLGTIIRTLDWFGYDQVICSRDSAELYNPKVISSTMGSFTKVKVLYTDITGILNGIELPIYGAEMNGSNLFEEHLDQPCIIVMGSESHGISEGVKPLLTKSISIPKYGNSESLNVGIATGIIASYLRMS